MNEQWRFLNLGYVDPVAYWTYPQAVMVAKSQKKVPNTVVFSIPSRETVNIGYYQDVEKEVNLSRCQDMGVEVVRRYGFGGGALLYDNDSRLFHIVVDRESFPTDYVDLITYASGGLLESVRNLGLDASFVPINDVIMASGKKIGMCSSFRTDFQNVTYVTISLHRNVNIDLAMELVTPPAEKFKDKSAQSVAERITTIGKELKRDITSDELIEAVRKGFEKAYGIDLRDGELTEGERAYYDEALQKNRKLEFLYKYSEKEKFGNDNLDLVNKGKLRRSEFIYKGKKLIRVTLLSDGKLIKNIMISGDYYAYPWDITDQLESALKGCRMDERIIRDKVVATFTSANGEVAMISPDEFAGTIMGAVNKIQS